VPDRDSAAPGHPVRAALRKAPRFGIGGHRSLIQEDAAATPLTAPFSSSLPPVPSSLIPSGRWS
jgi:hypothetical protein